ncbi:MAG: leucine-rich repeat domain-containing protein, partial [Paludibacteraceae bacterium]|nr:leucine-rich repeat domain-containing protein [Paludibacteraceae bacterium]
MKKLLFILAAVLLGSIGLQAGNTITYKATAILTGYNSSLKVGETTFGPRITSHEFSDSIGTITCAGEITKIDNNAFQRNPSLRAIEIPSSVKTIGTYAFYSCTYLRDIEIPSSVTAIGANAFYNCASLALVKVNWTDEQSIVPIDNTVFRQIANGAILLVPAGTVNLYRDVDGWMDFSNIVDPVQITYTASAQLNRTWLSIGAVTFGSPIVAHDFSNGVGTIVCAGPITKIGANAFLDCFGLTSIQIPNTVTAIEMQAFYNCNVLTSIAIPSSVTTIGYNAFYNCTGLTSIEIPNSVTTIEEKAFAFCTNLTSVTVNWPNAQSIVPIGDDVFQSIASDAKLYVPMGTTNLYQQANGWKNLIITASTSTFVYTASAQLTGAQFNVGATTFGPAITSHTFSNGTGMIACAGPITKIGTNAFYNCSGLTSIAIPSSVTEIQYGAFSGCSGLTSIEIPNSVTTIGQSAFNKCSGL